ncbi:unnamed protein product, partial [Phaeothamnion confervicola]
GRSSEGSDGWPLSFSLHGTAAAPAERAAEARGAFGGSSIASASFFAALAADGRRHRSLNRRQSERPPTHKAVSASDLSFFGQVQGRCAGSQAEISAWSFRHHNGIACGGSVDGGDDCSGRGSAAGGGGVAGNGSAGGGFGRSFERLVATAAACFCERRLRRSALRAWRSFAEAATQRAGDAVACSQRVCAVAARSVLPRWHARVRAIAATRRSFAAGEAHWLQKRGGAALTAWMAAAAMLKAGRRQHHSKPMRPIRAMQAALGRWRAAAAAQRVVRAAAEG